MALNGLGRVQLLPSERHQRYQPEADIVFVLDWTLVDERHHGDSLRKARRLLHWRCCDIGPPPLRGTAGGEPSRQENQTEALRHLNHTPPIFPGDQFHRDFSPLISRAARRGFDQAGTQTRHLGVHVILVRFALRCFPLLLFFFESLKGTVGILADKISHLTVQLFRLHEHVFHILKIHFDDYIVDAFLFVLIPVYRPNSIQSGRSKRFCCYFDVLLVGRLFKTSRDRGRSIISHQIGRIRGEHLHDLCTCPILSDIPGKRFIPDTHHFSDTIEGLGILTRIVPGLDPLRSTFTGAHDECREHASEHHRCNVRRPTSCFHHVCLPPLAFWSTYQDSITLTQTSDVLPKGWVIEIINLLPDQFVGRRSILRHMGTVPARCYSRFV